MASRNGPIATGTDGTDFLHRQRVASHYQVSAVNKSRLKFCIYLHYVLFLVMLAKLSPDLLDRLDIFVLEIEELFIPKPNLWEWIWASSILFTWTGFKAIRKNNVTSMKIYAVMNFVLSMCPILYALGYYFGDVWEFMESRDISKIEEVWQGYPVGIIWYAFLTVSSQVHLFQLIFSFKLIRSWTIRKKKE
ncbi:Protein jagunal [Halotydeus destructor]|nr:Protein jagunal [Halotydeus destructor]